MISALVLLFSFAPAAFEAASPPGFKVRHSENGVLSYINLPQNVTAAESLGWAESDRPEGPSQYQSLTMWCRADDKAVCVLYDKLQNAAGLQFAINQNYYSGGVYDLATDGFTNWTTTVDDIPTSHWANTVYFISSDSAASIETRDPTKFLQESYAYVTGFNGEILKISTNLEENTMFTQQKCVPGVGIHYFYKMTSTLPCTAETMLPWFFYMKDSDLSGVGIYTSGTTTVPTGRFDWLETWNRTDAVEALQDGPTCFADIGGSAGYTGLKVFIIDNPDEGLQRGGTLFYPSTDSASSSESRDSTKFLQESNVYVTGFNGEILKISTNAEENTMFKKQLCVPGVGLHFMFNMTSTLPCSADTLIPWFFLLKDGDFAGVGLYTSGQITLPESQFSWLENWNRTDAVDAVSDGPSCFADVAQFSGLLGMKIFFIDNPEEACVSVD